MCRVDASSKALIPYTDPVCATQRLYGSYMRHAVVACGWYFVGSSAYYSDEDASWLDAVQWEMKLTNGLTFDELGVRTRDLHLV